MKFFSIHSTVTPIVWDIDLAWHETSCHWPQQKKIWINFEIPDIDLVWKKGKSKGWYTLVISFHIASKENSQLAFFNNVFIPYWYFLQSKHYETQNPQSAAQETGTLLRSFTQNAKLMPVTMQTLLVFVETHYAPHVVLHLCSVIQLSVKCSPPK